MKIGKVDKRRRIFLKACLNYLLKKDVAYHFPRRTIRYENPLLSGKVNCQHKLIILLGKIGNVQISLIFLNGIEKLIMIGF